MITTSESWEVLWKCRRYNDKFGTANGLYILIQCHTEGRHCNHLSLATIISNNPFW